MKRLTASEITATNAERQAEMNAELNKKFDDAMDAVWGPVVDMANDMLTEFDWTAYTFIPRFFGGPYVNPNALPSKTATVDADFSPLDLDMPLNANTPPSWAIKERRVEWVLHNFTDGELAYLYKTLHDGRGLRRATVDTVMGKEKKS